MTAPCRIKAGSPRPLLDGPTGRDRRLIRKARRKARARCHEIDVERDAAITEAFRAEMGSVVRSASPLLVAMLAIENLTLDDAVATLEPMCSWPARPRLVGPKRPSRPYAHCLHLYQATRPSQFTIRPPAQVADQPSPGGVFGRAEGGFFTLYLVDHSLEVEATIGSASFETRFGELSIELDLELPDTMFTACVGRRIEEIVDYHAWRGRGWRVAEAVEEDYRWGRRLIVATGSSEYRVPWMR